MKKKILLLTLILSLGAYYQVEVISKTPETVVHADGGKKELKQASESEDVQEELKSPDGVAIEILPDGEWRIFAQGSGAYDFNEADEIREATRDATLRAKAAIAKFLRERIQSEEILDNTSEKLKRMSAKSGEEASIEVAKTTVKSSVERVVAIADEILDGVIVISTEKEPMGEGGNISVVVGVSSKTKKVSQALRSSTINLRGTSSKTGKSSGDAATMNKRNLPEKRRNKTDF